MAFWEGGWDRLASSTALHRGSSSPCSWLLAVAVALVTLLWPGGCCCFKAFQDKQLDCSLQTFRYVKQLLLWGLELELGEGEEDDALEISNLFPALLWGCCGGTGTLKVSVGLCGMGHIRVCRWRAEPQPCSPWGMDELELLCSCRASGALRGCSSALGLF